MNYDKHFSKLLVDNIFEDQNLCFELDDECAPNDYGYYSIYVFPESNGLIKYPDKKHRNFVDLACLAHEIGHHHSKVSGNWLENDLRRRYTLLAKNSFSLTKEDKFQILMEEYRGWCLGWEVLNKIFKPSKAEYAQYGSCALKCWKSYSRLFNKKTK